MPFSECSILSQELFFAVTAWFFISFCLGVYEHLPDLRHTCASLLLSNGISMKQIQIWLGHSTFSTTADIYAHLDFSAQEQSAATMGAMFVRGETPE